MTQAPPIITARRVEAYVAWALRVLAWLLGAILRLNPAGRSAKLQHLLSRAERAVEGILFLKAVALYGPAPRRRRHPRAAPPGFRRVERHAGAFFRSVNIRARKAGPLARVLALFDALAHPERAVAYFFKQICKGLRLASLVAVHPPACASADGASRVANCDFPDSS